MQRASDSTLKTSPTPPPITRVAGNEYEIVFDRLVLMIKQRTNKMGRYFFMGKGGGWKEMKKSCSKFCRGAHALVE